MLLLNKKQVIEDITALRDTEGLSTIDACVEYATKNNIEIEVIASFLKSAKNPLYQDLLADGERLALLKKSAD